MSFVDTQQTIDMYPSLKKRLKPGFCNIAYPLSSSYPFSARAGFLRHSSPHWATAEPEAGGIVSRTCTKSCAGTSVGQPLTIARNARAGYYDISLSDFSLLVPPCKPVFLLAICCSCLVCLHETSYTLFESAWVFFMSWGKVLPVFSFLNPTCARNRA